MRILGYVKMYFGLPCRLTEGLIRTYHNTIPYVPNYTAIHKRINNLDIKENPIKTGNNIVLAIDSTGINVTNRGDWMRHKWQKHRKGFLKIHVGVDMYTKQILTVKITDEHSHDFKHLKYLVRESVTQNNNQTAGRRGM